MGWQPGLEIFLNATLSDHPPYISPSPCPPSGLFEQWCWWTAKYAIQRWMSQDITDTLKSRVACREKNSMTIWMSSSLALHPQNSPPMTVLLPTSLPAHYPCETRPGPTWHSLVDLIELDIPACLGIVCWHENFPAIPVKTVDKRGICNTCRQIWELEFLRDGGGLWQRKDHQSLMVPQPGAKCRVGLVLGCCFISSCDVANVCI